MPAIYIGKISASVQTSFVKLLISHRGTLKYPVHTCDSLISICDFCSKIMTKRKHDKSFPSQSFNPPPLSNRWCRHQFLLWYVGSRPAFRVAGWDCFSLEICKNTAVFEVNSLVRCCFHFHGYLAAGSPETEGAGQWVRGNYAGKYWDIVTVSNLETTVCQYMFILRGADVH